MFRAQQNAFDDAVGKFPITKLQAVIDRRTAKATDENLTSENWEYILVWNKDSLHFRMIRR